MNRKFNAIKQGARAYDMQEEAVGTTAVFQHLRGDYREDRDRDSQRYTVKQEGKNHKFEQF